MTLFLEGVPADKVTACLKRAPGKELESGKLDSEESSAALAINTFGWFIDRPALLPHLPGAPVWTEVFSVDVEYCARFPWAGGRHPWLDAAIETDTHLIGVESKRFEPFRDAKNASFSDAYDRAVWGDQMGPFEKLRDALRSDPQRFQMLDAAQLIKHAFGLATDARRKAKRPHLHYLYAEPRSRGGQAIKQDALRLHRDEIAQFSASVSGAEVGFSACSYREWFSCWRSAELEAHAGRLGSRFEP